MRPLLLLDIDGVISLWGFDARTPPDGALAYVDGIPHFLSREAADRVIRLADTFECVWCSGWEDRADMHLPFMLGVPSGWPHIVFGDAPSGADRHYKLDAIEALVGPDRPVAWVDDGLDDSCRAWAAARPGPTLLVDTVPASGLLDEHVQTLERWAAGLSG